MNARLPIELGRFHHVGVAVREISQSVEMFARIFGAKVDSELFHDPHQGVRIQFIRLGDLRVELLEPAAEPSPVDGVLKRGVALYHICHEVDDLDAALGDLAAAKVTIVSPAKPAVAFGGRRVAFVICQGLLVELLETRPAGGGGDA